MLLYGNEQERLRVPFVRPEDENSFRHIYTTNMTPERTKLNANATPFVLGHNQVANNGTASTLSPESAHEKAEMDQPTSPHGLDIHSHKSEERLRTSDRGGDMDSPLREVTYSDPSGKDESTASETSRRESTSTSGGMWGSWRQGAGVGPDGTQRENGPSSRYQPAGRSGRGMKVLKPM
jgi:hypothetical protein